MYNSRLMTTGLSVALRPLFLPVPCPSSLCSLTFWKCGIKRRLPSKQAKVRGAEGPGHQRAVPSSEVKGYTFVFNEAKPPLMIASNLHRNSQMRVRTTAYTHDESDHIVYGVKNAIGTNLKFGNVRSAAADWSRFPVGTKFRIAGQPGVDL
jgi:hypothetical protein